MTSEKQIEANRRNAQAATGPKTEEGKSRSSLNAMRHGLTGQVTAMTQEDRAAHDAFSAPMLTDLAPEGAVETQLAQRIATDSWRLNRISAVEDNLFALGFYDHAAEVDADHPQIHAALTAAKTFEAEAKQFQLLSLYEQRLNRAVHKNLAALRQLQTQRKAERQRAMEEAKKLHRLDRRTMHDNPARAATATTATSYEVNGFVFSNEAIQAALDRERRLAQAERHDFRRHKHEKPRAQAA